MVGFGDGIDWDNHVDERLRDGLKPYSFSDDGRVMLIRKYLGNSRLRLLDCGCHIGLWARFFNEAGFEYVGVDQSAKAVETAKKLCPNDRFDVSFLWDMKYENEFDVVHFNAVLQHNLHSEKKRILPRVYVALKKNGLLFFSESTTAFPTKTQLTHDGYIKLVEPFGFKFISGYHKNELGIEDAYLFGRI